jgi:hypothetical protein
MFCRESLWETSPRPCNSLQQKGWLKGAQKAAARIDFGTRFAPTKAVQRTPESKIAEGLGKLTIPVQVPL